LEGDEVVEVEERSMCEEKRSPGRGGRSRGWRRLRRKKRYRKNSVLDIKHGLLGKTVFLVLVVPSRKIGDV